MISRANTLSELSANAAARYGDRIALYAKDRKFSFIEIEQRVRALAGGLSQLGVKPRQCVVLHLPNTWEWIVAYYAIARLNAIIVPANILLVAAEIQFIANDCGAAVVIAPASKMGELIDKAQPDARRIYISVGGSCAGANANFDELLASEPISLIPTVDEASISTIGYTSGTTGQPKGAMLSHRNVIMNTAMTANMHMRTAADVVVTALPCAHVYGNVVMNGAFFCGYSIVLLERFDAAEALEAVERFQATLIEGVPTMYFYLLGSADLGRRRLGSLTRATVGGQTMPPSQMEEVQRRLGCPLLELWGMTEIAGLGTTHPALGPQKLGSIGLPLPFNECRIGGLDDPAQTRRREEPGELLFRGPTVMKRYHARPEASAEAMLEDGWLRTGDVAYIDKAGYVFVIDRVKEMIITAGYNIYPSEVERVIAAHPAVQVVAVGSQPDNAKGELAHAYVVLKATATLDEHELLAHCRSHLAAYKVPKGIHFVSDLPKTSTGKIIRRALRNLNA